MRHDHNPSLGTSKHLGNNVSYWNRRLAQNVVFILSVSLPPAHTRLNPTLASFDSITRFKLGTCSYLMAGSSYVLHLLGIKDLLLRVPDGSTSILVRLASSRIFNFQKTTNARISSSFVQPYTVSHVTLQQCVLGPSM